MTVITFLSRVLGKIPGIREVESFSILQVRKILGTSVDVLERDGEE